jgi:hypothetical protein
MKLTSLLLLIIFSMPFVSEAQDLPYEYSKEYFDARQKELIAEVLGTSETSNDEDWYSMWEQTYEDRRSKILAQYPIPKLGCNEEGENCAISPDNESMKRLLATLGGTLVGPTVGAYESLITNPHGGSLINPGTYSGQWPGGGYTFDYGGNFGHVGYGLFGYGLYNY